MNTPMYRVTAPGLDEQTVSLMDLQALLEHRPDVIDPERVGYVMNKLQRIGFVEDATSGLKAVWDYDTLNLSSLTSDAD